MAIIKQSINRGYTKLFCWKSEGDGKLDLRSRFRGLRSTGYMIITITITIIIEGEQASIHMMCCIEWGARTHGFGRRSASASRRSMPLPRSSSVTGDPESYNQPRSRGTLWRSPIQWPPPHTHLLSKPQDPTRVLVSRSWNSVTPLT